MSDFYRSLSREVNGDFKLRKKAFKAGKPCAICGARKSPHEMMVAHKKPVRECTDLEALYDTSNWEVRCIDCEMKLNRKEDRLRAHSQSNTARNAGEA